MRHKAGFVALLLGMSNACSGAPAPEVVAPAMRPQNVGPAVESPARWSAFPQTVGVALATLVLADGRCLVTTDDGQRWIVSPKDKAKPCSGPGTASGSPSFEPLVGIQRVSDEFRFVAEGGIVYTAREPAGPFVKFSRAPVQLKRVASVGETIVGVDAEGGTHFFDGAWKTSSLASPARGIDVGIDRQGRVLWLGAPEALFLSTDFGRTFKPLANAPRVGAYEVGFTQKGELAARGALGNLVVEGDHVARSSERLRETESEDVEIEPREGPKASLLGEQRAALFGSDYAEIVEPFDGTRYGLARGELGGVFEKLPLAVFEACDNLKLATAGGVLAIACLKQDGDKPNLTAELWLAKDGKPASFEKAASLVTPSFNDVSFSVAADGTLLVVGACKDAPTPPPPGSPPEKSRPKSKAADRPELCSPKNPIQVRGDTVTVGTAQNLEEGSARSPLLSKDGHLAYFLGRARKDAKPAVFVSRDGGKTYQQRTIDAPQAAGWDNAPPTEEGDGGYQRPFYIPEQAQLTIDETGTLGLAGERDMGFSWVTLDGDGRVANVADPPEPSMTLGGAGNRVIALAYGQVDGALRGWESLDGGANWSEIATTQAVVRYGERGSGVVSCSTGGCLLGEELARVGWEGQLETAFSMTEEPPSDPLEARLGAPIVCQLVAKSEWVEIEGRPEERIGTSYSTYSTTPALPRLRDVMRGKTAFSVGTVAVEDQSVEVLSAAISDKDGGLGKKTVLGPAKPGPNSYSATLLRWQAEGYVALRGNVPTLKTGGLDTSKKLEGLELAWQNQLLGINGKKTVKLEQAWTNGFVSGTQLRPGMMTIAAQGVVLQAWSGAKALYTDNQSQTAFDYPSLPQLLTDARPVGNLDAAYLGGAPYAIAFVDRAPTANVFVSARATVEGKARDGKKEPASKPQVTPLATTIAAGNTEIDWLYAGERVGIVTLTAAASADSAARATGFLLADDGTLGEPIDLPTLSDLPDRPKACSTEQRKTPRTVSPHFSKVGAFIQDDGRHPVVVSEAQPATASASLVGPTVPLDPLWLLTDGAVLHGSKKEPCVSGFRASGLRPGTVAVIGGDLERSFLLRLTSGMRKRRAKGAPAVWGQFIQARPMTCRYQPDQAIPMEVANRASQRMADDQP